MSVSSRKNSSKGKHYIAKDGDCISSIAYINGFFPDTLWNHEKNKKLKKIEKTKKFF